jgi:hypothetical protein
LDSAYSCPTITGETRMPVAQRSRIISCCSTIYSALTPQSTHPNDAEETATYNLSPSLHTHTTEQIKSVNGLRAELLDVRSIHTKSASPSHHRASRDRCMHTRCSQHRKYPSLPSQPAAPCRRERQRQRKPQRCAPPRCQCTWARAAEGRRQLSLARWRGRLGCGQAG